MRKILVLLILLGVLAFPGSAFAVSGTYYVYNFYDGVLRLSSSSYMVAHEAASASYVDYGATRFRVGQTLVQTQSTLLGALADDAGTITDETTEANDATPNDMILLPDPVQVNDAYYFGGIDLFSRVDVVIGIQGVGAWAVTWEYYHADTTWVALDGVVDNTNNFKAAAGTHSVTFTEPPN